jgi:hypothetical protein
MIVPLNSYIGGAYLGETRKTSILCGLSHH